MLDSFKTQLKDAITSVCNPTLVILFGSHAYGEPNSDSDIDLLIVDDTGLTKRELRQKIREALRFLKYPKDILISNSKDYTFYSKEPGSVFREACEKGITLWSR